MAAPEKNEQQQSADQAEDIGTLSIERLTTKALGAIATDEPALLEKISIEATERKDRSRFSYLTPEQRAKLDQLEKGVFYSGIKHGQ